MKRRNALRISMFALVLFAAAALVYFSALVNRHTGLEPAAGAQSNIGYDEAIAPARFAQFRADCTLAGGERVTGEVNVVQESNPAQLEIMEIKADDGRRMVVRPAQAECTFAPY